MKKVTFEDADGLSMAQRDLAKFGKALAEYTKETNGKNTRLQSPLLNPVPGMVAQLQTTDVIRKQDTFKHVQLLQ